MNTIDITIYIEEEKVRAVSDALKSEGITVEDKLKSMFSFLYEQLVPVEQRMVIDAKLRQERIDMEREAEARRQFAVYHVRENGADSYFTCDHIPHIYAAAHRYRLYSRNELSSSPKRLDEAFLETRPLLQSEYEDLCNNMADDKRIKAIFDFDLDSGTLSFSESPYDLPKTYRLHDVSVAAFKAGRNQMMNFDDRVFLFRKALHGKELVPDEPEDMAPPIQQV